VSGASGDPPREPGRATDTPATLGHPRVHLRRTHSTNDRARELAIAGSPHGTLVTASEQTAGRGRQGRRWTAPAGSSLLMSLLLRTGGQTVATAPPSVLPLIAAVAVCDAIEAIDEGAQIKWPNDIVVAADPPTGGAGGSGLGKLAGILTEARPQAGWAVLGIGLNVAVRLDQLPAELRAQPDRTLAEDRAMPASSGLPAATLGCSPREIEPILERLLAALEHRLRAPIPDTLAEWRRRDVLLGREVTWGEGSGRAEGIDDAGGLLVALADGRRVTLAAGEVHLQRIR
jgi:BirA family transcriptional regulator, biotin operon repressor / biotin---[acetyl-CoA-carboxylase] ligase